MRLKKHMCFVKNCIRENRGRMGNICMGIKTAKYPTNQTKVMREEVKMKKTAKGESMMKTVRVTSGDMDEEMEGLEKEEMR